MTLRDAAFRAQFVGSPRAESLALRKPSRYRVARAGRYCEYSVSSEREFRCVGFPHVTASCGRSVRFPAFFFSGRPAGGRW